MCVNQPQEFRKCFNWSAEHMNWISVCSDVIPKAGLCNVIIQKAFQLSYYSTKINFIGSILHGKEAEKTFSVWFGATNESDSNKNYAFLWGLYHWRYNDDDCVSILTTWRLITYPYFRSARTGYCYAFIYRNLKYSLFFKLWLIVMQY